VRDTGAIILIDLTDYFTAQGMMGNFNGIRDVYSIANDADGGIWITGFGTTGSGDRAFLAYIPEPATLGLLALGAMAMLRRR
jgi:hypothetical protein